MHSPAFKSVLSATGYLSEELLPAPGLISASGNITFRLRPLLTDRVGLNADAVFTAQDNPITVFKDAGEHPPSEADLQNWHEVAWNIGVAPLLWIITPTEVRLYNCYESPRQESSKHPSSSPLAVFEHEQPAQLEQLNSACGRFATETGAFWSSEIGQKIDRRHRVDRDLLCEIKALEEKLTALPPLTGGTLVDEFSEVEASRDFAQRLIGRCIFTSYLMDRGVMQRFLPDYLPSNVADMFSSPDTAFALFQWLRTTFNGDLFPMDDPGEEHRRLGEEHLHLLRDFVEGFSLITGQGRLFRFRYNAIPVDLISSIYQQFARSSAADQARAQGLHYTPMELVHLTLDPVFESLSPNARVIDPTCGSGAFLVESFRRLVWKHTQGGPASRNLVRKVLYHQLYGVDINRSALGIAAFSLYLAALELDDDPIEQISDLKFHRLIGETLFEANALQNDQLNGPLQQTFDAVVGNPPWTFVGNTGSMHTRKPRNADNPRPRRSPDQDFLWAAVRLAGEHGRIGMIMKASPFFSKEPQAITARNALLSALSPVALVNLSALRKEGLFPDASGPAAILFARCALMQQKDQLLVGSIPWTPDFKRNGVFHIGPGELKTLPLDRILRTPAMLKAATFGTARDGWLIEKLEKSFPSLNDLLSAKDINTRGQGFKVKGNGYKQSPERYFSLKVITANHYRPFRLNHDQLEPFEFEKLHRTRTPEIFEGPLLICPKGAFKSAAEPGRYSATYSEASVLYNESFYGISFKGKSTTLAKLLSAILNSSIFSFQLIFGGGVWGLERPTVEPHDVLSLRVPNLENLNPELIDRALRAETAAAKNPKNLGRLKDLDQAVNALYGLEIEEEILVEESIKQARFYIQEGANTRRTYIAPPPMNALKEYAREVLETVNSYLRLRGKRHLEAIVYPNHLLPPLSGDSVPGVIAVRFVMVNGPVPKEPLIHRGKTNDAAPFVSIMRPNDDIPPYLNERRQLRIYNAQDLYILKPSESRYWTRVTGLNDADIILADHWLKEPHAPIS